MEPKIITRDEIKVIGMQYIGSNENGEIPQLWQQFMPRVGEIQNGLGNNVFYGYESTCKCDPKYIACIEVTSLDDIPEGMVGWTIPSAKYAVFTYKGMPETLDNTFTENIFNKWLPAAGLEPSANYNLEVYDERFKFSSEDSEVDMYVPVK